MGGYSIDDEGVVVRLQRMPVINVAIKYIGGGYANLSYHVENDELTSIFYVLENVANVWYVCSPRGMNEVEKIRLPEPVHSDLPR